MIFGAAAVIAVEVYFGVAEKDGLSALGNGFDLDRNYRLIVCCVYVYIRGAFYRTEILVAYADGTAA